MKIAILGGTHGNEQVGIEAMRALKNKRPDGCLHEYQTFLANPQAHEKRLRFVDTDLNRTFGKNGVRKGVEGKRSEELENEISGHFDFLLDFHTTTSNIGLTVILCKTDERSRKAAAWLKQKIPGLKIIVTTKLDDECCYTNVLTPSALTTEVGPVANNVVSSSLLFATHKMARELLTWDFSDDIDLSQVEYYQSLEEILLPEGEGWFIHPDLEHASWRELKSGDPIFINMRGETLPYLGTETVYPYFINEAAYQKDRIAFAIARKCIGLK